MVRLVLLVLLLPAAHAAESVQHDYLIRAAHTDFRALTAIYGLDGQVARLQLGLPIEPKVFDAALGFIGTGGDLTDFTLAPVLRILYRYPDRIPSGLKSRMERAVLDFRYWLYPDNGDVHSLASMWLENRQINYHSLEYLAGQLYPERPFSKTGKPGSWHMEHAERYLLSWMALRARTGFSEWLSPVTYGDDFIGLLNLVDFAHDPHIEQLASHFCDLLLLDLALHSYDGGLRCSTGRTFSSMLKDPRTTEGAALLMLATGVPDTEAPVLGAGGAIFQAMSKYRAPSIIAAIARRPTQPELIHESTGWDPQEGIAWGLDPMRLADIFTFWGTGSNLHPLVFRGTAHAASTWHIRGGDLAETKRMEADLANLADRGPYALFRVNLETYRTPDYVASTAQDYRKGLGSFQQQPWMASLGGKANIWTNHPAADTENVRPNFWCGNGVMPRVAQHKNVVISLFHIPPGDARPYSHAHFPVSEFDEFRRVKGWLLARRGDGYVAMAASPAIEPGQNETEWLSNAPDSAWICLLGRKAEDGSFTAFIKRVTADAPQLAGTNFMYQEIAFGWDGPFRFQGQPISISDYPRYDSPYITTRRGELDFQVHAGGQQYRIDLSDLRDTPVSVR